MAPPHLGHGWCGFARRGRHFDFTGLIRLRLCIEQSPDLLDPVTTDAIRKEARVADAVEAGGQDVDQEAADELRRGQPHDLHAVAALDPVVFPSEGYCVGIGADEAVVGDRDPVRVAAQVGQHRFGSAEGWLGIHDPFDFAQRCEMCGEGIRIGQPHQMPKNASLPALCNLASPSRNRRRNNRDRTFTGRKNPGRQATQRCRRVTARRPAR